MTSDLYPGYLHDVEGIKLGHWEDMEKATGVSVVLCPDNTVGAVDVRGGSPGTRETDLLRPENSVAHVNAVVLAGGSAFGLDAASGVMTFLREQNVGFETGFGKVPIITSAVIFDLGLGSALAYPNAQAGYDAATAAGKSTDQGNVGAGAGASVGKINGMGTAMKAGLGQASLKNGDLIVSCAVVVNAVGDVYDLDNGLTPIVGFCLPSGDFVSSEQMIRESANQLNEGTNTTIGVVATNAKFDKAQLLKVSQMAHDGYALAIRPVHTSADGDSIFALATGEVDGDVNVVGTMAVEAMRRAIVNACLAAEDVHGLRSHKDLK